MEIKAEQKYLIISPSKVRPVIYMIKKLKPVEAVERLPLVAKRAAELVRKVIQAAIANAKAKGISENDLIFKEIIANEGPDKNLKRGRPVSRGQWHPIKKRMSHIRVILTTKSKSEIQPQSGLPSPKPENKREKKGEKINGTKS